MKKSNIQIKNKIKDKIFFDLVMRSPAAAKAFAVFAVSFLFYRFEIENAVYVKIVDALSFVVIATSLLRFYWAKQILQSNVCSINTSNKLIGAIFLNIISWCGIFFIFLNNLNLQGFEFVAIFLLMAAMANASILTLGSYPKLAITFQSLLIMGSFTAFVGGYFSNKDNAYLYMSFVVLAYLSYLIKQTNMHYKQLKNKIKTEVRLFLTVQKLKETNEKTLRLTSLSENNSRMAALGQIAGGVAHEINNPLATISMAQELINRSSGIPNAEERLAKVMTYTEKSIGAVNKIANIVKSLKGISREKSNVHIPECELTSIVEKFISLNCERFLANSIEIYLDKKDEQVFVLASNAQIVQVLTNLIDNAYEALLRQPIGLSNKTIRIYYAESEEFVFVSIENTGVIQSADVREKIFYPFFTTKDVGEGAGLGLSLSRAIVNSLGGKIWLDTDKANTTFTFTLRKAKTKDHKVAI